METQRFYDGLAATYHALYPDWERTITEQADALRNLLEQPPTGAAIADTACGIGTQLLGLAALGYHMFGSDLSPLAVDRAAHECRQRGLEACLRVADMRSLPWDDRSMDAVVCADNALPHLLTDHDALAALREAHRVLRPGAPIAITTRDYDAVLAERPTTTPLQVMCDDDGVRTVTFQLWTWRERSDVYDLEHFQVAEGQCWSTVRRSATYRAYTADHLRRLAETVAFENVRWWSPGEAHFFQPVMTARAG